jgi:5-carboxyvanillate decarboxylase
VPKHRLIATEEHVTTEAFLRTAHELEVLPSDRVEVELMRTVENADVWHRALVDLDARLAVMDACGQDFALLSLNPPGVQPYRAADAVGLARSFNDELAEIVRRHPGRFAGLGTVAPQDPESAAAEIERVMGPLGLSGIMINSHTVGHYLDEPQFRPLLESAQENRATIYLHPRIPSMAAPYSQYGMTAAIWGYQAEAGLHAMRLILSGTFDRLPNLTFVLGHLGEGIPYWLRRIDNRHAFAQRVAGATTAMPKLEMAPSEYFRRNFVLTTSGMDDPDVLTLAVRAVGDDNIMLAIDHPYEDSAAAVAFLRDAPITENQRAKIVGRTAERVFALD